MATTPDLVPMTCQNCGKKIAEVKLNEGTVSVKCYRCGVVNTISKEPRIPRVSDKVRLSGKTK